MKIAYIVPGTGVSGGMAVICQHANRLVKKGHKVDLLSIGDAAPITWFPDNKVSVYSIDDWQEEVDILVATSWATPFYLDKIDSLVKCYFVQSDETRFHEDWSKWRHIAALSYHFNVNYLTEAKWIKDWLKSNFNHNAELIPNGLDPDIFHPTTPLIKKGKRRRILLEGAIGLPYKGMKEAFEAVKDLDAEIWCVSSYGHPESSWRCDKFFEQVPMTEMKEIYSSCDILLKLSRVEGFFGPPMEMMACGGAVVVGKVTGYDEYIVDGVNALVVDPLDILNASNAVHKLIVDDELRSRLIEQGRKTAAEWRWEDSIDKLEKYYFELLKKSASGNQLKNSWSYSKSLIYLYNAIATNFNPAELSGGSSMQIPPHVMKVGIFLIKNKSFHKICDILKYFYRAYLRFKWY